MKTQKWWLTVGLAFGLAQYTQANLIQNGGFETGNLTDWSLSLGSSEFVAPAGFDGYSAHSGNYFLAIGNVGGDGILMQQNIGDSAGTTYDLTWWLAGNGTGTSDFNVYWNGSLVSSLGNPIPNQPYTEYSVEVTGTGSDTLSFGVRDDQDWDALDDISLNPSGVPDDGATAGLLGLALGGLALLRRKLAIA